MCTRCGEVFFWKGIATGREVGLLLPLGRRAFMRFSFVLSFFILYLKIGVDSYKAIQNAP